jgi:hypothetical protein
MSSTRTPERVYDNDDRKTLLDAYYDGGGKVGEELDLRRDVYEGLIAVANYAAKDALNYEHVIEEVECKLGSIGWVPCSVPGCKNLRRTRLVTEWKTQ